MGTELVGLHGIKTVEKGLAPYDDSIRRRVEVGFWFGDYIPKLQR